MTQPPFSLTVTALSADGEPFNLDCIAALRTLPGKRSVLDARWNGRPVIAKIFSHPLKARRHMQTDAAGLEKLQQLRLPAPRLLLCGKTADHNYVTITEKITAASTLLQAYQTASDHHQKLELLLLAVAALARHHEKGVLQKDLHLENFLLRDGRLFCLDPATIRFRKQPIKKKTAIAQVAILARILPEDDTGSLDQLCKHYAVNRGWQITEKDLARLHTEAARSRKQAVKRALKKCLRTSRRCIEIRRPGQYAIADRAFHDTADFDHLLTDIDNLMTAGQTLKSGNTCFVSRFACAGRDIVVKRYNYKNPLHCLRHTIKGSRARKCWLNAHLLQMLDIPTAPPLAFIEKRKGPLLLRSYFITEYVPGRRLYDFLRDDSVTAEHRSAVTEQLKHLLNLLAKHKITHGDLKHTNIILTDTGPTLTDLDAMKIHRCPWTFCRRRLKDRIRIPQENQQTP